jgi:hypothetical protein
MLQYIDAGFLRIIILFFIPIIIIHTAALAYFLIDISRSKFKDPNNKILWVVVILAAPLIGAILYLIIGKKQKIS